MFLNGQLKGGNIRTYALLSMLAVSLPFATVAVAEEEESDSLIEVINVTAERRESTVQDTPLAVSAYDDDALERSNIANAREIQFAIPNTLYTQGNFTGSNLVIRGIGNNAIAQSSDSGAGIHFNGAYQVGSTLFAQDFYDVERVEVLRGPQGTLYGRNTTAGVVNIIPAKPKNDFDGGTQLITGDYNERKFVTAVNIPIIPGFFQTRVAGLDIERDGVVENLGTGNTIDGRNIQSYRVMARIGASTESLFDITAIRSHFEEEDSRMRSSKQLCHTQDDYAGPHNVGCFPNRSLYDDNAFGAPAGFATLAGSIGTLLMITPYGGALGVDDMGDFIANLTGHLGADASIPNPSYMLQAYRESSNPLHQYAGATQINPRDLRQVNSTFDPYYQQEEDIEHVEFVFRPGGSIDLSFISHEQESSIYTNTDYNWSRWPDTVPSLDADMNPIQVPNVFTVQGATDLSNIAGGIAGVLGLGGIDLGLMRGPNSCGTHVDDMGMSIASPTGCTLFTLDPLSPRAVGGIVQTDHNNSNQLSAWDTSAGRSTQELTEFKLATDSDGGFNILLGAFDLMYESEGIYEVHANALSALNQFNLWGHFGDPMSTNPPGSRATSIPGAGMYDATDAAMSASNAAGYNCPELDPLAVIGAAPADSVKSCHALSFFRSHTASYKLESSGSFTELYFGSSAFRLTLGFRTTEETKSVTDRQTFLNNPTLSPVPTARTDGTSLAVSGLGTLSNGLAREVVVGTGMDAMTVNMPVWERVAGQTGDTSINFLGSVAPLTAIARATDKGADSALVTASGKNIRSGFGTGGTIIGNNPVPNYSTRTGEWNEPTTKLGLDFYIGERSLLYFLFSNSYKSGGINPPAATGAFPATFEPEFVDAVEFGFKTAGNRATFNFTGFMYDYTGLQVSKIIDRTSVNENINAEIMGAEMEFLWSPSDNWLFGLTASFLDTNILEGRSTNTADPADYYRGANGAAATTDARFVNIKNGDNSIYLLENPDYDGTYSFNEEHCGTVVGAGTDNPERGRLTCANVFVTNPYEFFIEYDANGAPMRDALGRTVLVEENLWPSNQFLNNLQVSVPIGIERELEGNKLPSSPESSVNVHWTYQFNLDGSRARFRMDYYWQDEFYYRIYNTEQDLIKSWQVWNASFAVSSPDNTWEIEVWAKNLRDYDNITGAYFTDASSGNFTNVFLLEPRTVGFSVSIKY